MFEAILHGKKWYLAEIIFVGEARETSDEESAIRVSSSPGITKWVICKIQFVSIKWNKNEIFEKGK